MIAQCRAAGVPPFFKQAGARPFDGWRSVPVRASGNAPNGSAQEQCWLRLKDRKGGDMEEWHCPVCRAQGGLEMAGAL
jgi:hypothetical protein